MESPGPSQHASLRTAAWSSVPGNVSVHLLPGLYVSWPPLAGWWVRHEVWMLTIILGTSSLAELYQAAKHVTRKMMQFVGLLHTCPPLGRIQPAGEPNKTVGYKD